MSSIQIDPIVKLAEESGSLTPSQVFGLKAHLNSVASQLLHCRYYYFLFDHSPVKGAQDYDVNLDDRVCKEACVYGYLMGIHSIIDSFPYVLNHLFKIEDIESRSVGWYSKFLSGYSKYEFYDKMLAYQNMDAFNLLKETVNSIKHQTGPALILGSDGEGLIPKLQYSSYCLSDDGKYIKREPKNIYLFQDAKDLMKEVDSKLVPGYIELVNMVAESLLEKLSNLDKMVDKKKSRVS